MPSILTARHMPGLTLALYTLSDIASCEPALKNLYASSRSPLINKSQRALIRSVTSACFASGVMSLADIEAHPARDAATDTAASGTATLEQRLNKTLCIVNRITPHLCTHSRVLHGRNIVAVAIWRRFRGFPTPAAHFWSPGRDRRSAPFSCANYR